MNARGCVSKLSHRMSACLLSAPSFCFIRPFAGLVATPTVYLHLPRMQQACQTSYFSTKSNDEYKAKDHLYRDPMSLSSKPKPVEDQTTAPKKPSAIAGVTLAAGTAMTGFALASVISSATQVPLSGIPVSIVLGMAMRTGFISQPLQETLQPGLSLASKNVLQLGIVCVGIKLSIWQLATASTTSVPVVVAAVTSGMIGIPRIASALGVNAPHLVPLMTAGTSICGVTAISALAPAISAPHKDVAVAVANTVAFGTIGMLAYPYLLHGLVGSDSTAVGLCMGVAIHDTSQVLGAALSYKETYGDEIAFELAAVTKLVRNLGLAAAIPYLTFQHQNRQTPVIKQNKQQLDQPIREETMSGLPTFTKFVPPFLVAFLSMSVLRSIGDVSIDPDHVDVYNALVSFVGNDMSKYALGTAMAATGLSIDANSLRTVGWRPFALGGTSAMLVGGVGFGTSMVVSYLSSTGSLIA